MLGLPEMPVYAIVIGYIPRQHPVAFHHSPQSAMIHLTEVEAMETKDVILELRTKRGLSQDDLAEKVMVTRQAVSRWENGETVPNTDTLKLLSSWNVSLVETDVLGSWRIWILF